MPTENNKKISCIIPAYNEEKSIAKILSVVFEASDYISEILIIDDGSTDKTSDAVEKIIGKFPNARLLVNKKNIGKSKTIARGILESSGDFLFFLDADLLDLNSKNIEDLAKPIKNGSADVVISIRGNSPWWMKKINLDFMSGERILSKSVMLPYIEQLSKLKNFTLEVFINRIIIEKKLKIKTVPISNALNDKKWFKRGFFVGLKDEILMWRDIFGIISVYELINQNIKMRKLLV